MKYIKMAISSNFGNVFSVLIASAWLPFLPMKPIHIVMQNLLYDFSQLAIPWDKMDREFTDEPQSWSAKGIFKFMAFIGPISSIFDICTFSFMWFYYGIQSPTVFVESLNTTIPNPQVTEFQTAWFVEGLTTQCLIVHMIRTRKIPFIQSIAAWPTLVGTFLSAGVGIALPFIPVINGYLNLVPLPGLYYAFLTGSIITYCALTTMVKFIYIRIFDEWI